MLCNSGGEPGREARYVHPPRPQCLDGLVVIPNPEPSMLLRPILQARIPVVLLEHDLPGVLCVAIEEFEGGRVGTQHLLDLGHRRIAACRMTFADPADC